MAQYRLTVDGTFASGETWSFRQHYASGAPIATIAADWSAAWSTAWTTAVTGLENVYPTGTAIVSTSAAELTGVPYREGAKIVTPGSHPGVLLTDSLPEQTVILVSRRGANVGKKNRGRTSLPAPAEDMATGGELTTTAASHCSTSINGVRAAMTGAGHTPVVYNVKASTSDPVVQVNKTIVTEEVDRVLRTQRRRTRGRKAVYV